MLSLVRRLLLLLVLSSQATARTGDDGKAGTAPIGGIYEVISISGEVRVWHRFGASWKTVAKGERLVAGELVQMTANTELKLKGVVSGAGEKVPRGFVLKSQDPLITRIDDGSLRELQLGGFYVAMDGVGDKAEPTLEPSLLSSAWWRKISILDDKKMPDEAQIQMAAQLGDESKDTPTDQVGEIKIDHPRNGDTYIVEALPTDVAVSWSELPPGVKGLKVFFWKSDQGNPVLVGQTGNPFFRLPIRSGGRYYVRVESPDGSWRSKPHLFIILTPDQIAGTAPTSSPSPDVLQGDP